MIFRKLHSDSQLPVIKTKLSAGIDLYSYETLTLSSLETKVIGTGVWFDKDGGPVGDRSMFSGSYFFILELRSSLRAKGLSSLGTGIIDFDYTDEWKVVICNITENTQRIEKGERIAQAVLLRHFSTYLVGGAAEERYTRTGGFGSTGR